MENFNGTLNGGQSETSFGKGLIFAILGMLVGIAICVAVLNIFDVIWWWAFGAVIGLGISGGWSLGKGPDGASRQILVIVLSVIGGIATLAVGFAIFWYNQGLGRDFADAVSLALDLIFDDFEFVIDIVLITALAIATAWRRFDKSQLLTDGDDDVEVFTPHVDSGTMKPNATKSEMEDLLNQDIPTLTVDETWECKKCGATNRSIINTCEYCGGSK